MCDRQILQDQGYDVNTRDLGLSWLCVLERHGQIQNFYGVTEQEALRLATRYVDQLGRDYARQRQRLVCDGCGH